MKGKNKRKGKKIMVSEYFMIILQFQIQLILYMKSSQKEQYPLNEETSNKVTGRIQNVSQKMNEVQVGVQKSLQESSMDITIVKNKTELKNSFAMIRKVEANVYNEEVFVDDQFKLVHDRLSKKTTKRLKDIFHPNTSLFVDVKTGKMRDKPTEKEFIAGGPSYVCQINLLPFSHYQALIEPDYINPQGFYHVVMWKDGSLYKQIVDDEFYFDEKLNEIEHHPLLKNHPWVHILVKAWAKKNRGYANLASTDPFEFIRTFSYPDWETINPGMEKLEYLINRFSKVSNGKQYMIGRTKNKSDVGLYGFTPNCAAYVITGHYQEYGGVFVKIKPCNYDKWNGAFCDVQSEMPEEMPALEKGEFLIPSKQFINVFHILYSTSQKYYPKQQKPQICYNKYTLAIDARDTKSKILTFEVSRGEKHYQVGLNFYFPKVSIFDLMRNGHGIHQETDMIVPWCKILLGVQVENCNMDASYVESMKEKFLDNRNDQIDFITSTNQYNYVMSDYFKGYSHEVSYCLTLQPGKYFLRVKSQQKKSEYRCYVNSVGLGSQIKITDSKMENAEAMHFFKDTLQSKVKKQKRNVTYMNKLKKGSWISCNNDFRNMGYATLMAKTIQHAENRIIIHVDPKILEEHGYAIKGKKDKEKITKELNSDDSYLVILKQDKGWKGLEERIWPPPGITFFKQPRK